MSDHPDDLTIPTPDVRVEPAQYEFSPEQDRTIGGLGRQMKFVGTFFLLYSVFGVVAMVMTIVRSSKLNVDLGAIFGVFVGLWTISAGRSFEEVALTRGRDVSHLMAALTRLNQVYALIAALMTLVLVLVAVFLGVALFAGAKDHWLSIGGYPIR